MHLLDYPNDFPDSNVAEVAEKRFEEHYLRPLGDDVRFVRLESRFIVKSQGLLVDIFRQKCTGKISAATILLRRRLRH